MQERTLPRRRFLKLAVGGAALTTASTFASSCEEEDAGKVDHNINLPATDNRPATIAERFRGISPQELVFLPSGGVPPTYETQVWRVNGARLTTDTLTSATLKILTSDTFEKTDFKLRAMVVAGNGQEFRIESVKSQTAKEALNQNFVASEDHPKRALVVEIKANNKGISTLYKTGLTAYLEPVDVSGNPVENQRRIYRIKGLEQPSTTATQKSQ